MGYVDILVCSAGVAGLNADVVDYPIDEGKQVSTPTSTNSLLQPGRRATDESPPVRPHRAGRHLGRPSTTICTITPLCSFKSVGSLVLVNKGPNQGDGGLRVFFHYPMTGFWDHTFFYVACCKTHDLRHCTAERFFASQREDRDIKLPRRNKCAVVDRILVKCCELRKARMHGARTRVQLRVMPPSRLAETARSGGELVPKPVEVNPFASRDEPLHIRTAEAEMPEQRVLENVLPWANTRNGASISTNKITQ